MNLEEKIGQLFIVGFEGTELSESIAGLINLSVALKIDQMMLSPLSLGVHQW